MIDAAEVTLDAVVPHLVDVLYVSLCRRVTNEQWRVLHWLTAQCCANVDVPV